MNYQVSISEFTKKGASTISDIRLAAKMGHTKRHGYTPLLDVTVGNQNYHLCLQGYIEGQDLRTGEGFDSASISDALLDELDQPYDARDEVFDMQHGPWFEWINEDGSPVGDVFDEISLNPADEVEKLEKLVAANLQSVGCPRM